MGSINRLKASMEALKGITSHDNFLGNETLSWIANETKIKETIDSSIINDRLRSFRDSYRDFSQRLSKYGSKNEHKKGENIALIPKIICRPPPAETNFSLGKKSFT